MEYVFIHVALWHWNTYMSFHASKEHSDMVDPHNPWVWYGRRSGRRGGGGRWGGDGGRKGGDGGRKGGDGGRRGGGRRGGGGHRKGNDNRNGYGSRLGWW